MNICVLCSCVCFSLKMCTISDLSSYCAPSWLLHFSEQSFSSPHPKVPGAARAHAPHAQRCNSPLCNALKAVGDGILGQKTAYNFNI